MGSEPNVELARACGLKVRRGILVDETMATSDPDIFAVGDVAERPGRPSGLWSTAAAGARTAAAALLGTPVDHVPMLARMKLKSDGIDLRSFGSLRREPGDEVIVAPPFEPTWWRVVIREGAIVGAVNAGPPGSASPLWNLVQSASMTDDHAQALREGNLDALDAA